MALRFSSWRAHWCRTHRQSCLLVVNATCTRHSRARVGFLGLLRLLLQLLALDHPQLLGQLLGRVLGQLLGFAAAEQAHGLAKGRGQRGRVAELARRLRAGARQPRRRGGRAGKVQRRRGSSAEPPSSSPEECGWQEDVWQLTCFARARAGCRARGWQEGGGAAPKGAVLLELDERGADLPLQPLREPGAAQAPRVGEAFVRTTLCTSTAASRVCSARSRPQRLRPVTPGPPHNRRTACHSLHRLRRLFARLWQKAPWR